MSGLSGMPTGYFLYLKSEQEGVSSDTKTQILDIARERTYILPRSFLGYYLKNGLFEKSLIDWCVQFGSSEKTFLDIGAHTGTYSISLAKHFGTVHAFEPQRGTFYALCGSVALSGLQNVECHRFGLGEVSQEGKQILKIISPDGGGSSLHARTQTVLREETIEVRTLDSFGIENIGFIKMDVEDNELSVLKGGVETLNRCGKPRILFECNEGSSKNTELFAFLKELGYKTTQIAGIPNMYLAFVD